MTYDLENTINLLASFHHANGGFSIPSGYLYPGSIVVLAAYLHALKIPAENLNFPSDRGYLDAVGFERSLFGQDNYQHCRINAGINYSPIVHIRDINAVDTATTTINSCITKQTENRLSHGISALKHVIGELHDNVWSHGLESGFSIAQRSKIPGTNNHCINFALADTGLGFLEEIKRAKISGIDNHSSAIEWCIQEGNTTKPSASDSWAQSIPLDCANSPFPIDVTSRPNTSNHHQGLGLAKLLDLVSDYKGELLLATGNALLQITPSGKTYTLLQRPWKGVALSCRLKISELCNGSTPPEIPSEIRSIINRLRG